MSDLLQAILIVVVSLTASMGLAELLARRLTATRNDRADQRQDER